MLTPKIYPTNAVANIAAVPQKQILNTDFLMLEPPVFAAIAPSNAKKRREKQY